METRKIIVQLSSDLVSLESKNKSRSQFLDVFTNHSAEDIVAIACQCWKIDANEQQNYCLIFEDTKKYLTEGN